MEDVVNVAIIGLGKVGSRFIEELSEYKGNGVKILGAAEINMDAPGIKVASEKGIRLYNNEAQILEIRDRIDIIFDLTGDKSVERKLRLSMAQSGASTIVVSRPVALLVWKLISKEKLPLHTTKN